MKVKFFGPVSRVTGSCYHLVDDGRGMDLLVDFGLVQSEGRQLADDEHDLPFNLGRLRHVFLTHAHIDHCGIIPLLYKKGYRGQVWCTGETAELAKINLRDAARLGGVPYREEWIDRISWREPNPRRLFNALFPVEADLFACFFRSAHIVGAVSISLTWGPPGAQRTIVFSGDLGPNEDGSETQALMKYRMNAQFQPDAQEPTADYAVCESTYGDRQRPPLGWLDRVGLLAAALERVSDGGGIGIIPAFSIGRCQDLLFDLAVIRALEPERFGSVGFYLDSPMGELVGTEYARAIRRTELNKKGEAKSTWLNTRLGEWLGMDRSLEGELLLRDLVASVLNRKPPPEAIRTRFPGTLASRIDGSFLKRADRFTVLPAGNPAVVVCSGGMCVGGPVVRYLVEHLRRESTCVIFPGYVASGTPGHRLLGLMGVPLEERERMGDVLEFASGSRTERIPAAEIRASITKIDGYSGHADQTGLVRWLLHPGTGVPLARTVFLTHGTDQARRRLKQVLEESCPSGMDVILPETGHGYFDLDLGRWVGDEEATEVIRLRARIRDLEAEIARLRRRPDPR